MANTLYFPDGTHEVLFDSDPTEEFAKIIDERLGRDCLEVFEGLVGLGKAGSTVEELESALADMTDERDDLSNELDNIQSDRDYLGGQLDTVLDILSKIESECDFLDFALSQTRVDRKECQKAVDKIRKVIGEVV